MEKGERRRGRQPERSASSLIPKTDVTLKEILEFVREGREAGLPRMRLVREAPAKRITSRPRRKKPPAAP